MTKPTLLESICAKITEVVLAYLKQDPAVSPVEATERFQHELGHLFPIPEPEPPSPPPSPPKRIRTVRNLGRKMNRDKFPPEYVMENLYEAGGHVYARTHLRFGAKPGDELGDHPKPGKRPRGVIVRLDGYRFPRAHIVFVLHHGRWPRAKLFHCNLDRSDDRIENLLEATNSEINRSSRVSSRNLAGVKGVGSPQRTRNGTRYRSSIMRNGLARSLGSFATASEAHRAYAAAAKELHGHFNPASKLYQDDLPHEP